MGWSPILFFSETGDSFIRVCCEGCIHQLVLFASTVYCLHQLCIVYINCVLFTSIVYCLRQLCIVCVNCVLFTSTVYCLRQLCIVYVNCVLFMSIVYCLHQLCIVYVNCVLFTSIVYCLRVCVAGKMFPTHGILYTAPFTDDALYMEQYSKANFWSVVVYSCSLFLDTNYTLSCIL